MKPKEKEIICAIDGSSLMPEFKQFVRLFIFIVGISAIWIKNWIIWSVSFSMLVSLYLLINKKIK